MSPHVKDRPCGLLNCFNLISFGSHLHFTIPSFFPFSQIWQTSSMALFALHWPITFFPPVTDLKVTDPVCPATLDLSIQRLHVHSHWLRAHALGGEAAITLGLFQSAETLISKAYAAIQINTSEPVEVVQWKECVCMCVWYLGIRHCRWSILQYCVMVMCIHSSIFWILAKSREPIPADFGLVASQSQATKHSHLGTIDSIESLHCNRPFSSSS